MSNSFFAAFAALWVAVTPDNMLTVKAPEFIYTGIPGSVTDQYRRSKDVADGCAIVEHGKVVGWSLNCFPTPSGAEHAERFY